MPQFYYKIYNNSKGNYSSGFMSVQKNIINSSEGNICPLCKSFYGSQCYEGMCSSCFKKKKTFQKKQSDGDNFIKPIEIKIQTVSKQQEFNNTTGQIKQKQKDCKKCYRCQKKIRLLGVECKCGFIYCNNHRLPEEHECEYDYKSHAQQQLKKQIIKVSHDKIAPI